MGTESVKILAAVAAGYMIGRTRKARFVLALASGAMMAGRGLAQMGLDQSKLRGVLTEVLADVQSSAGKALNARAERFSDSLRSQTEQLTGLAGGQDQDEATEDEEEPVDGAPDQSQAREGADGGDEDGESPQTSRRPERGRAASGSGRRVAQTARGGR